MLTHVLGDLWFETREGGALVLRFAADAPALPDAFVVALWGINAPLVAFRHVTSIRGRQVFGASEWHSAGAPAVPLPAEVRLFGPASRKAGVL